jgi:hypothetical protein
MTAPDDDDDPDLLLAALLAAIAAGDVVHDDPDLAAVLAWLERHRTPARPVSLLTDARSGAGS